MHPYAYGRRSDRLSKPNTVLYTAPEWDDDIKIPESPVNEAPSPASSSSSYSGGPSRRRSKNTGPHIPRPPNAFMIFRSHFWKEQKATSVERDHREISRICGVRWKALPAEQQEHYKHLAKLEKERHMMKYPDYKYAPASRAGKAQHKKAKKGSEAEEARCQLLAAMVMHGAHGDELEGAARSLDGCYQSPIPRPLTPVRYELRRSTPSSDSSTPPPPMASPPVQEPQFVSSPDAYIATEHIPPLDLNASALSVEHAFTQHAPMMMTGFDPLLSQMYFNQETSDASYVWYMPSGDFIQPPAVETPSYSYEAFDVVHAPQASYSAQTFTTDGYYYEGGYTTYNGWAQDTPSSYGYPSEFDQVAPEPAFPFPYTHVPSPKSETL